MTKQKERETELLGFSEKLSSANAELQTERSEWEAKVCFMCGCVWGWFVCVEGEGEHMCVGFIHTLNIVSLSH